jgi:hypothetical protein
VILRGAVHRRTTTLALLFASTAALSTESARADVTSWLGVGGGAAVERNHDTHKSTTVPTMTYSIGVGSSPLASVVVGGLLRGTTLFDRGTDLGLTARVCSGGFARGDWGIALDAGALWRPWLSEYGEWPLQAVVTGGSPWGFQIALGTNLASVSGGTPAQGVFAAIELDLLRFTVMRQGSSERWWYNPDPAGGRASSP